jgi:hypothetical protein
MFNNLKRLFYLIIAVSAIWTLYAFNKPTATDLCKTTNYSFRDGETLVYKIYYNWNVVWIPAGEVQFKIKENKDNFEITALGQTYKSYNSFFKVNDYYYSKFDKHSLLPRNFVRIIEEGKYRLYDSIAFDQINRRAMTWHGKTKAQAKFQVLPLDGCVHDLISNIYMLRNLPEAAIIADDQLPVKVFFDKESYPLNIKIGSREVKEIKDLGTFNTIKLMPQLVEGYVFKKGDEMKIWVSDDYNRIPLMVESPVVVGTIKAVLKSSAGLRHPMHSKINE